MEPITRREALQLIGGAAALPWIQDTYGGFKMSIATYTLREFTLEKACQQMHDLGVSYAEVNPKHIAVDADAKAVADAQALLKKSEVTPVAYGVFYTERSKEDRKKAIESVFAIATTLGIKVISCDPEEEWLGAMEERAAKTGVKLGLHNHGPKSRYPTIEKLLKTLEGRHENVGVTVDTGHLIRAKQDPVKAVKEIGKRVHGCHLKDNKGEEASVILGTGDLDLVGVLRALRDAKFEGALSLEYERNARDPIEDVKKCLEAVRAAVRKI